MLDVRTERDLMRILGDAPHDFRRRFGCLNRCYREFDLIDPERPGKTRRILSVKGYWKIYLNRLYLRLLLPKLSPSPYSHGGVRGRSIVSNALQHRDSVYACSIDISEFFPSIHYRRVYGLFAGRFRCSPDVARICTRLCTHDYHLAAGLPTSPILANELLDRVDRRIGGVCESANLVYTRFVDDITISGAFDLEDSGIIRLVREIVMQDGFMLSPTKQVSGKISDGFAITGIRIKRGNLDVRKQYIQKVICQIEDAKRLVEGSPDFSGRYYTPDQIIGRVKFICSINPGRTASLMRLCMQVPWKKVAEEAERRGLIIQKKRLIPRTAEPA